MVFGDRDSGVKWLVQLVIQCMYNYVYMICTTNIQTSNMYMIGGDYYIRGVKNPTEINRLSISLGGV